MAITKTRNMLIDVARQLFAKLGVENTTMNDIAVASHKGRRTLYTYFNNKNEVYKAVVESELDKMIKALQAVVEKDLPADEKLMLFFYTRLDAVKNVVARNGNLRADFFRDIWRVQNVRKTFDRKETEILKEILQKGVDEGTLSMPDVDFTAEIVHNALRGLEVPYIRGLINPKDSDNKRRYLNISHLIFQGIKKNKN
ncbi:MULTISPECIES: TetR/AcrR family transcriptional regulator [unclassified Dysgonomonas]|uniref:TetR/AcrR family transcriptional regulator n=1 Tax=unclassified Dysgonomonas TaxID=2630389 RepID=UPI00067FA29A|nr:MULTISPECIES: TetR/AcrR family transcriptional regulator [unclassified Dysgonomonas]MBD8348160.1 TetR/AcrR family transcriptional regulator [Dysgonomonas sp. HGC4]MBF0575863.1 TetR/AcrR family transcriptional regulator [Dysgonomonas sp. GY617]